MKAASEADKGRREQFRRSRQRRELDLGTEPALDIGDRGNGAPERRGVSFRWFAGTILTGAASTLLMGGALYSALDHQARFALKPLAAQASENTEAVTALYLDEPGTGAASSGKANRLSVAIPRFSSRQIMHLDTVTRVGEREYIKVKPFARVNASLTGTRTALTEDLKAFDPQSIFETDPQKDADEPAGAAPDTSEQVEGEVSLVVRDLAAAGLDATARPAHGDIPEDEIHALVEAARARGNGATVVLTRTAGSEGGDMFDRGFDAFAYAPAPETAMNGFADLVTDAYAENVSEVAKSAGRMPRPAREDERLAADERILRVRADDTLNTLLVDNGASEAEAEAAIAAMAPDYSPETLEEGDRLRLTVSPSPRERGRLRPVRVSVYESEVHRATVVLNETDEFVAIDDPGDLREEPGTAVAARETGSGGTISLYHSLYETALKNEVPRALVDELVDVYAYDVDFNRRVGADDSFEVFYELEQSGGASAHARGEVLYTALTVDGEMRRYYRFESPEDGTIDYFDEYGRSARKFLLRKPLASGVYRSGYGMRRHPILGYARMHTGVDYSAPRGTHIFASGDGTVERAGWKSGYGRSVKLTHANGYATTYNHMNAIASGIEPGRTVRQGDVIGYVGTTGQSTGNHLHYEVLIDGRFVNPMRIAVPRGHELEGEALAAFHDERERIDRIMNRAPASNQLAIIR